jgi:hypothetical protein
MLGLSIFRQRLLRGLTGLIYIIVTLQLVRFHMGSAPGVDMATYLQGTTPLPFQKRYLPGLLIRGMLHFDPVVRFCNAHTAFMAPPSRFCSLILSALALGIAGYYCRRLYKSVSSNGRLAFVTYPLFLLLVLVSYTVHAEHNTNLPYDFPSVAFYSAGLYMIYTRRFPQLLLVMLLGTLNRETTLFLIPIFLLDAASRPEAGVFIPLQQRFDIRRIPWLRTVLLCLAWAAVEGSLSHIFAGNDRSQTYLRGRENLARLRFGLLPNIMNMCGYLLPVIMIVQPSIRPTRFGNYTLVAYPWIVVMYFYGIVIETRIYGELVPYVAVASLLLIEQIACSSTIRDCLPDPSKA